MLLQEGVPNIPGYEKKNKVYESEKKHKYKISLSMSCMLPELIKLSIWAFFHASKLKKDCITASIIFWFKIEPDSN